MMTAAAFDMLGARSSAFERWSQDRRLATPSVLTRFGMLRC